MDAPFFHEIKQQRKGSEGLEEGKRRRENKKIQMADIQRDSVHGSLNILYDICRSGNFIHL